MLIKLEGRIKSEVALQEGNIFSTTDMDTEETALDNRLTGTKF